MKKREHTLQELLETGMMLFTQRRFSEAAGVFEKAIWLDPNNHEAWNNRGNCLQALGNYFDGILNYDRAIACDPAISGHYSNRGAALYELGKYDKALTDYHKAVDIEPTLAAGWYNIGNLHRFLGKPHLAADAYRKAIELQPDYVDANLAMSFAELEIGDWPAGWERFEWRWKSGQIYPRGLKPQWEGEDLNGKTILLHAEQGHGDALQFLRMANVLRDRYPDATIDVEVRLPLVRIASTLRGVSNVITMGDRPGRYDYVCALMSVPRVIGMTVADIPGECPYFSANEERIAKWQDDLDRGFAPYPHKLKIGICWAGMNRPNQPGAAQIDKRRSMQLSQFAPIALPGIVWISLQKDTSPELLKAQVPNGMFLADNSEQFDDFADTAALIKCLDLVISVDTAIVHLAAALGKPTWMLSRFDGCWRWMGNRPDSPWYPTMRQFRQESPGDWDSVMAQVRHALIMTLNGAPTVPGIASARLVPQQAVAAAAE